MNESIEVQSPGSSATYARSHHFAFSQVKRNPIVDIDSTSPEVHNSVYRKKKKMKVFTNFGKSRYS